VASVGLAFLWRRTLSGYRHRLDRSEEARERWHRDAERWRRETAQLLQGLGQAIDRQFDQWGLTASEKEVAMLLLKGLSQKEIAAVREVREKTIRQQSLSVYRKGGLAGRAELAAYFLEDLLLPPQGVSSGAASPREDAPGREVKAPGRG
jgi:DNA-binding CsgD family transcriptional regulator